MDATDLLAGESLIPVVVIDNADRAVGLAETLLAYGVTSIEITLRTPQALAAIEAVAARLPQMLTGAGSVTSTQQLAAAREAGARFAVSPGSTPDLLARADLPLLPGAATATECLALRDAGYKLIKFFPAEAAGGVATLRSWAGPLPELSFCPTGGIHAGNAADYLTLDNVACIGGSWFVPAKSLADGDFAEVAALTRDAVRICTGA